MPRSSGESRLLKKHLAGVNFDAVVEPSSDELILIEVTKRDDLSKIRDDIVKINALRLQRLADGVLVRGYILVNDRPTTSMVETGVLNKVKVMSVGDFFNEFFQYDAYVIWTNGFDLAPEFLYAKVRAQAAA